MDVLASDGCKCQQLKVLVSIFKMVIMIEFE